MQKIPEVLKPLANKARKTAVKYGHNLMNFSPSTPDGALSKCVFLWSASRDRFDFW